MKKIGKCLTCGKEFEYNTSNRVGKFCSNSCRYKKHSEIIKNSYTPELRQLKKDLAIKQMKDKEQIKIRKTKLKGRKMTEEHIQKLKEAHPKMDCNSYRERALEHYGHVCARCGKSFDESNLHVHHIDGNNGGTEIGNHSIENLMVLCRSCHAKLHNELRKSTIQFAGLSHFKKAAHEIFKGLQQMGLDITDVNFKDTPQRVARAYYEIFEGVQDTEEQVKQILSTGFPANGMNNMITACGVCAFSMCPHHLLPVEYRINVGYIPKGDGLVLGISKLSRLVRILAKRPVLQETLCEDIVDALMSIGSEGAAVAISGRHMCMRMRGIKDPTASVYCQSMRGCFKTNHACREEFLMLTKDGLEFK